jgi:4-amino-4-deoxy-L-arabinose transferase-like glycosyltransferase
MRAWADSLPILSNLRTATFSTKIGLALGAVALSAFFILNLVSLNSYPTPQPDDTFFGVVANEFIEHGKFGNPLYDDMSGSSESLFHLGRVYMLMIVAMFKLFGVGLYQGRLLVLIGHWVTALELFFIGKLLWGKAEGLIAAAVLLTSWYAFWSAHTLRPDSWVNAGGALCILLLLWLLRSPSHKAGFIVGLATVLILDIHIKAVHYSLATWFLAAAIMLRRRETRPIFISLAAGAVLGVVYWFAIHVLPDPQLALAQLSSGPNARQLTPQADVLYQISETIKVFSTIFQSTQFGWVEFGYILVGAVALAFRRQSSDKLIMAYAAIYLISFTFLMPVKALYHIFLLLPLLSLMIARGIPALAEALLKRFNTLLVSLAWATVMFAAPLLLLYTAGDIKFAWANRQISYDNYANQLLRLVPADANVLGENTWWWSFRTGRFTSDISFINGLKSDSPVEEIEARFEQVFRNRQVEYVFFDEAFGFWKDGSPLKPKIHTLFAAYLEQHCQPLGMVRDYFYGVDLGKLEIKETTVYQCN